MVGLLIRMKLAVLRRVATGTRANWMILGGLLGLAAAIGTIRVATFQVDDIATVRDLLAVVFAIWAFGWMLGPAWTGEPVLRAEHFALLAVPRRTLAVGLLGTAFVGITTAVTLLAFAATAVFAARLGGVLPVIVSVPAIVLQLTVVVLLSRLTARMFGALSRSRIGAATTAVITAAMLVVSSSGWILFIVLDAVLANGFSPTFSAVVRALPFGWGLVAVDAAARSDWVMTALALLGLVALATVLGLVWSRLLGPPRWGRSVVRGSTAERAVPAGRAFSSATSAVFLKELRTWWRNPLRVQNLVVPPVFAVMSCLLPLVFGSPALLPFTGALTALMGAANSANLYGQDGTALWLTLVTPGTEQSDVRGRQLAWLALFGPMSVLLTILGTVLSGRADLWPWASAATVALLGAGAGLLPLVALTQLAPGPDPHRSKYSPMDHGDATGGGFVMLFLALGLTLPALAPVIIGTALHSEQLRVAGVAVGVVTAMVYWSVFGRLARRKLATRGPELLYLMRAGKEHQQRAAAEASVLKAMPKPKQRLLWASFVIGCIALFPQALTPLGKKLSGDDDKGWFLALYLPEAWQWPMIVLMFVLAALAFALSARTYLTEQRSLRQRRARKGQGLLA